MASERAWYVSLPHATYGIEVAAGLVVRAPPIARWLLGQTEQAALGWARRKGATVERIGVSDGKQ